MNDKKVNDKFEFGPMEKDPGKHSGWRVRHERKIRLVFSRRHRVNVQAVS